MPLAYKPKKTNHVPLDDKIVDEALNTLREIGLTTASVSKSGLAEINLDELIPNLPAPSAYDPVPTSEEIPYQPFSFYPAIVRDVAMWVDGSVTKDQVMDILETAAGPLCLRISLFDEFAKDGRTSYAFRLVFQSFDKTLTDAEVEPYMEAVYQAVKMAGFETR